LRIRFQEDLLSCVFYLSALSKEPAGDGKDSRAISAQDLLERALVTLARQAYQFEIRSLFDCQSRS
jgi:hypothetical protein